MSLLRGFFGAALVLISGTLNAETPPRAEIAETPPQAEAIFAGGCFWCMEPPFDELPGVLETTSGYIGGHLENPSYDQVVTDTTGHAEAVRVTYRPEMISYLELLQVFWRNIDPVDAGGQFCDRGSSYRSGIFYLDDQQRRAAKASREKLRQSDRFEDPIVTEITEASRFWPAEEYHQNYYQNHPLRYRYYRSRCGRDQRLTDLWGGRSG